MGCGGSRQRGTQKDNLFRFFLSSLPSLLRCVRYLTLSIRWTLLVSIGTQDTLAPAAWGRPSTAGPKTTFKLVLLGAHFVGKTCISLRYCRGWTNLNELPTVGASFYAKNLEVNGVPIKFEVSNAATRQTCSYSPEKNSTDPIALFPLCNNYYLSRFGYVAMRGVHWTHKKQLLVHPSKMC